MASWPRRTTTFCGADVVVDFSGLKEPLTFRGVRHEHPLSVHVFHGVRWDDDVVWLECRRAGCGWRTDKRPLFPAKKPTGWEKLVELIEEVESG